MTAPDNVEVSIIVAMSEERTIGREGALPWRLSDDLRRFKALTMGHPIIMGRKTYESIGRPLPGRPNIILSRADGLAFAGCQTMSSLESAIAAGAAHGTHKVFIIGGAQVYRIAIPLAHSIELTEVHARVPGDANFPDLGEGWREVSRVDAPADERNEFAHSFIRLERAAP